MFYEYDKENISNCSVVVISSAIGQDNIELALRNNLGFTVSRAEMLAELMRMKLNIVVAGLMERQQQPHLLPQLQK